MLVFYECVFVFLVKLSCLVLLFTNIVCYLLDLVKETVKNNKT